VIEFASAAVASQPQPERLVGHSAREVEEELLHSHAVNGSQIVPRSVRLAGSAGLAESEALVQDDVCALPKAGEAQRVASIGAIQHGK